MVHAVSATRVSPVEERFRLSGGSVTRGLNDLRQIAPPKLFVLHAMLVVMFHFHLLH
jgi:hypothetical protein